MRLRGHRTPEESRLPQGIVSLQVFRTYHCRLRGLDVSRCACGTYTRFPSLMVSDERGEPIVQTALWMVWNALILTELNFVVRIRRLATRLSAMKVG